MSNNLDIYEYHLKSSSIPKYRMSLTLQIDLCLRVTCPPLWVSQYVNSSHERSIWTASAHKDTLG